ncbi:hypothetical protein AMECASPLE_006854 [Ameca splendens]|uniref:Uncharacterized protein n=1 Tax=Ameca splendens TaxID=208324 RepID=A0ABV0ZJ87_9TELE
MSFGVFKQEAASMSPLDYREYLDTTQAGSPPCFVKGYFWSNFASQKQIIVLLDYLAGCRQVLPASHRFHRTCPPSTALKRPSSGTVLPLVIAHSWFGSLLTHRTVCSFWSV